MRRRRRDREAEKGLSSRDLQVLLAANLSSCNVNKSAYEEYSRIYSNCGVHSPRAQEQTQKQ
jgi:hypothetical protein